jgi:putative tryptophan/tyrosine transport system substrate-binding protein
MRRREFIAGLGGAAAWPLVARAQQPLPVIGFLSSRSPSEAGYILEPFRRGLREAGYLEGQNVLIEYRWAEHQPDRLPALAADLVARQVNVIIAGGTAIPAKAAFLKIPVPVVFTTGEDPVTNGLVEHLGQQIHVLSVSSDSDVELALYSQVSDRAARRSFRATSLSVVGLDGPLQERVEAAALKAGD